LYGCHPKYSVFSMMYLPTPPWAEAVAARATMAAEMLRVLILMEVEMRVNETLNDLLRRMRPTSRRDESPLIALYEYEGGL